MRDSWGAGFPNSFLSRLFCSLETGVKKKKNFSPKEIKIQIIQLQRPPLHIHGDIEDIMELLVYLLFFLLL